MLLVTIVQSQIVLPLVYEPSIETGPAASVKFTDSMTVRCVKIRPIEDNCLTALSGDMCCKGSLN